MLTLHDPMSPMRRQALRFFGSLPLASLAATPEVSPGSPWQEHQFATPDGTLAYARAGQGPLLVLLPGGPGASGWGLRNWVAPLTEFLSVIVLDAIGRGRSARLADPSGYTLARDVSDLERLREHLGLARLTVYGHSYGGLVAQAWSAAHPDRVERLVLGNTLHGARSWQDQVDRCNRHLQLQQPRLWTRLMTLREQGLSSAAPEYQALLAPALTPMYWFNPEQAERQAPPPSPKPEADRFNPTVYQALLGPDPEWRVAGHLGAVELLPGLTQVRAPALVITGRADRIGPPHVAEQIAQALPRADLQVFERSGHRPFAEQSQAWAGCLREFLKAA